MRYKNADIINIAVCVPRYHILVKMWYIWGSVGTVLQAVMCMIFLCVREFYFVFNWVKKCKNVSLQGLYYIKMYVIYHIYEKEAH